MNILTWNVAWCGQRSKKFQEIQSRLQALSPSVACLTETAADYMRDGHTIRSNPDHGYPIKVQRHKVILWSKSAWKNVDTLGDIDLPPGRFIYGETDTLKVMGICIPWHDAHVSTGRRDQKQWAEHLQYLSILKSVIAEKSPHIIMGDFNQRVPFDSIYPRNKDVSERLLDTLDGYDICTAGIHPLSVDHIAVTEKLTVGSRTLIDPTWGQAKLSDHYGVAVDVAF